MSKFTTRMVLHDADWDDYNDLHTYMNQEGFTDEITSSDGITYKLPDAEYDISGNFDVDDVCTKAKRAAKRTGKEYKVFVTKSAGRKWIGLDKA
ncbi:hypothetical protein ACEUC3_18730 [Aeromonas bivalvium]|uniref:hypothetical protein n=1 Tax=Aeromonas bivalvium TaxID=440079 RepID=UPI0038CF3432